MSGNNATSHFQVFSTKTLRLRDISISHGFGGTGAIENFGGLDLRNVQFSSNNASSDGGAITNHDTLTATNCVWTGNAATSGSGGAIFSDGTSVTISGSKFETNSANAAGGAIFAPQAAQVTISGSRFSGNAVTDTFAEGGALNVAGPLSVTDCTFDQNHGSRGGAISVLTGSKTTVRLSRFNDNYAAYGGAIRQEDGELTIENASFDHNGYANNSKITTGGGAISHGGGSATVTNVTLSDGFASYGGAMDHSAGTTTLTNVTISGNSAVGAGGIDQGGGSISFTNVTCTANDAGFFAGGIAVRVGTATFKNTILSKNTGTPNLMKGDGAVINSSGFNLCDDTSGIGRLNGPGDKNGPSFDPLLGPLAMNGGFSKTHRPGAGSPVID